MTDLRLTLMILTACLAIGFTWNVAGLISAWRDWRAVLASQQNGPRQIIAVAALRRKVLRALMQLGLMWLYGSRVLSGPARPVSAALVGVVLIAALTIDTVADGLDRRLLYWFLREPKGRRQGDS